MIRYLILTAALGSGGVAAWLSVAGTPPKEKPAVVAEQRPVATSDILVAAADVAAGEEIKPADLRWKAWPAAALAPSFIARSTHPGALKTLANSRARQRLRKGDPLSQDALAAPGAGFMATVLPSGKRAVAVRVSAEATAGGFVLPNDRVDVIHTTTSKGAASGQPVSTSRVILQDVRVLAVDQSQESNAKSDQKAVVGRTATLELDIGQVETITAAAASGTLTLALRSAMDGAVASAPAPTRHTVTVRRDRAVEVVTVSAHTAWPQASSEVR
ncbi:Flp pilus assembly protein CpaB [Jiella sp. M17.18]|uniref:Flp pilus assembly protein CpaB n=1 Tax=Jiella sp. M17.18 TaxID=3234247 RepID=UPI0034DF1A8B